jgi:tRNA threonylcarbamoyl adenosine modification protein YjeE
METTVRTLAELEAEAVRFAGSLAPHEQGATLVTLSGELGAGKTAFVKAVARALGVEEVVTSPTFVLEKIYLLPPKLGGLASKFGRLIHIDAYRLSRGSDLAPLGFDELMQGAGNLILLEWPERVRDALPAPSICISLVVLDDGARKISYA